uniref:Docking protein 2 n=1 Tax=Sparus aurata TaxID=8175 RepID=A0A671TPM6_SPAAU
MSSGPRCDSGEGSFEFDTKQGNILFQAVEAAINLQRISLPHRQTSGGGQVCPETGGGGGGASPCTPPVIPPEPEYSLPFDTIATNVMANILNVHQALGDKSAIDPLYDSIDEMKIRNIFPSSGDAVGPTYGKVDHIYDEPEGCAAAAANAPATQIPTSVYDDPEEMRGDAWRIMGTAADPKGHQYPYNPRVDDYAVPKRAQRALPVTQSTDKEEDSEEESQEKEEECVLQVCPTEHTGVSY